MTTLGRDTNVKISIIVPAFNEEKLIAGCVQTICVRLVRILRALRTLEESKHLCTTHGLKFAGQELLRDCAREIRGSIGR